MKRRENKETVVSQGGGCCGPAPVVKETPKVSCCGSEPAAEEKLETNDGGCCG